MRKYTIVSAMVLLFAPATAMGQVKPMPDVSAAEAGHFLARQGEDRVDLAAAPGGGREPFFGLPRGRTLQHQPCTIWHDGRLVHRGHCLANTENGYPLSLFVERQDSGCEVDFTRTRAGSTAYLWGYRQTCVYGDAKEEVEDTREAVEPRDGCWVGKRLRVCLTR